MLICCISGAKHVETSVSVEGALAANLQGKAAPNVKPSVAKHWRVTIVLHQKPHLNIQM
jgi:hypothetical protein